MADLDLERAERLLQSARDLFARGDLAGVAGLAYQAFESALIALTIEKNGTNAGSHLARRERAKALLSHHRDKIDFLWEVRNVDFYGNPQPFQPKREVAKAEVKEALETVEAIVQEVRQILAPEESQEQAPSASYNTDLDFPLPSP